METTSVKRAVEPEPAPQGLNDSDQFRLFEAEAVIFDKFDEVVRRKQHLEAEKNLMLAILEEGISCFQKQLFARTQKGKKLFRDAEAWILQCDVDRLFSFESICDMLGISPNYLRSGLIAWKSRQLTREREADLYRMDSGPNVSAAATGLLSPG